MIRFNDNYVALVNVYSTTLTLSGISFQNGNHVLHANDWNLTGLNPGECIRLYAGDKPPLDLPVGCTQVYDYGGSRNARDIWFSGQTVITINPSTRLTYQGIKGH
jgi:hypothetical protein